MINTYKPTVYCQDQLYEKIKEKIRFSPTYIKAINRKGGKAVSEENSTCTTKYGWEEWGNNQPLSPDNVLIL